MEAFMSIPQIYTLGIDAGLKGGVSFYDGEMMHTHKMPVYKNTKDKNKVSPEELASLFYYFHGDEKSIKLALLEEVHAMPKQGVVSMFSFGEAYGIILGVLGALNIPHLKISPSVWKPNLNLSKNKQDSVNLANEKYNLKLKKSQDGEAESALLAGIAWSLKK